MVVAGVGAVIGVIGWFSPMLVGSGHSLAEAALAGNLVFVVIPIFFLIRFLMTVSSCGTGALWEEFLPLCWH